MRGRKGDRKKGDLKRKKLEINLLQVGRKTRVGAGRDRKERKTTEICSVHVPPHSKYNHGVLKIRSNTKYRN